MPSNQQTPIYGFSQEALNRRTKFGLPIDLSGSYFLQYGPSTAITAATETSLITGATGTTLANPIGPYKGSLVVPGTGLSYSGQLEPIVGPGAGYRIKLFGTYGTNATPPTLTIRPGIVSTAGVFTALNTTTAITTTTALTNQGWEAIFEIFVQTYGSGTSGSFLVNEEVKLATAAGTTTLIKPVPLVTASLDTTVQYFWDVRATFGAAAAGTTITMLGGYIEALN